MKGRISSVKAYIILSPDLLEFALVYLIILVFSLGKITVQVVVLTG
jgi:hypothetical protein